MPVEGKTVNCTKCGKEIAEGTAFCQNCGEPAGVGGRLPASSLENTPQKKKKKSIIPVILLVLVIVAGGIGAALYFTGDSYRCKKSIEMVEQYLEEGDYEEALACCEEVLELDDQYVDAYLISADIYIELEAYGEAADILEKGSKAVKDRDELQEQLEEKLDDVYRAQAKALIGVWKLNYNLADLIPEQYSGLLDLNAEIPILLEIREDGIMYFSVDKEYFAGAQEWLSSAASMLAAAYTKLPVVSDLAGNMAGNFADILTGLLIDNIGVTYFYEVKESALHCVWSEEGSAEEIYAFEIDGSTLTFLEEQTPGVESYYLKFPLALERI